MLLVLAAWLPSTAPAADQQLARGKLLVATELVRGDFFDETVVLLLHYDEAGAMGLVINRPTEFDAGDLLADIDAALDYRGKIFWGGPVDIASLRALLYTDMPPEGAIAIVDSVYQVPIGDWPDNVPADPARLRFFVGYAGWGAGQLDHELARGSWHVVPASVELILAQDTKSLWQKLTPPQVIRTALP